MGSMNDMHNLIEQMVSDISSQAVRLDDLRLRMFMNWLNAHNSKVKTITESNEQAGKQIQMDVDFNSVGNMQERLQTGLRTWFESLAVKGLLWEYHLILDEIAWWHNLDHRMLSMILKSEAGK